MTARGIAEQIDMLDRGVPFRDNVEAIITAALAAQLDLVIEELDRVVMPRDAWVEMRARLDVLRALSPTSDYMQQVQRAEQAEAALHQAREALKKYGVHVYGCSVRRLENIPCTCGLDAAVGAKEPQP